LHFLYFYNGFIFIKDLILYYILSVSPIVNHTTTAIMGEDASILSSPVERAYAQLEPEPEPVVLRTSSRKRQKRTGALEN
jgi:hypothetical protein